MPNGTLERRIPMHVTTYFEPDGERRALASYADRARRQGWQVAHKLDLYNFAKTAFEGSGDEGSRRAAFQRIYDDLRRYWQVFRNTGNHWDAAETFDALAVNFQPFSRGAGARLTSLTRDDYD